MLGPKNGAILWVSQYHCLRLDIGDDILQSPLHFFGLLPLVCPSTHQHIVQWIKKKHLAANSLKLNESPLTSENTIFKWKKENMFPPMLPLLSL